MSKNKEAPRAEEESPAERKHPLEWAKEAKTPKHLYAGASVLGASRWITGVLVTKDEYEAALARFMKITLGNGPRRNKA